MKDLLKWLLVILVGLLIGLSINKWSEYYDSLYEKECETVNAIVIEKEYEPKRTTVVPAGKTCIPVICSEKYYTTIRYEEYTYTIDNQYVYENSNIGDEIEIYMITKTNKKNGKQIKIFTY